MMNRHGTRILIAGLGNILLRDGGVGIHAVKDMQRRGFPDALVVEIGTSVNDAYYLFEWADKVLAIDAMQAGSAPGAIYSFAVRDGNEPELQVSQQQAALINLVRLLPEHARPEIKILGIEPFMIDHGLELSHAVRSSFSYLIKIAEEVVVGWRMQALCAEKASSSR